MVWSLDTDDFGGFNGPAYPLLHEINRVLASGETYDPVGTGCVGTAPQCDLTAITPDFTTTTTTPGGPTTTTTYNPISQCQQSGDTAPYPGDCHLYYQCSDPEGDGEFVLVVHTCGDYFFSDNTDSCVNELLPGDNLVCQS